MKVMLETHNTETGKNITTGPYEKGTLAIWLEHARAENSESHFVWTVIEQENKDV